MSKVIEEKSFLKAKKSFFIPFDALKAFSCKEIHSNKKQEKLLIQNKETFNSQGINIIHCKNIVYLINNILNNFKLFFKLDSVILHRKVFFKSFNLGNFCCSHLHDFVSYGFVKLNLNLL